MLLVTKVADIGDIEAVTDGNPVRRYRAPAATPQTPFRNSSEASGIPTLLLRSVITLSEDLRGDYPGPAQHAGSKLA